MNKKVISIVAIIALVAILGVCLVACNADSYAKKLITFLFILSLQGLLLYVYYISFAK